VQTVVLTLLFSKDADLTTAYVPDDKLAAARHIFECTSVACATPHCEATRRVVDHLNACADAACGFCSSIRDKTEIIHAQWAADRHFVE
jgi:hypothetical protein